MEATTLGLGFSDCELQHGHCLLENSISYCMGLLCLICFHLAVKLKNIICLLTGLIQSTLFVLQLKLQDFGQNMYLKHTFAFHSDYCTEIENHLCFCRVLKLS